MKSIILLVVLFCASCDHTIGMQNETGDCEVAKDMERVVEASLDMNRESLWMCWNPGSSYHGGPCVKECMVPGNQGTFCYIPEPQHPLEE